MISTQLKTKIDATQPFHVYYHLELLNNDQKNGQPTPNLEFKETRNSSYLNCPENYFASIIRFNMMTPSLPMFIPQVKIGQSDVNKLIYEISMTNASGTSSTVSVSYIPSLNVSSTPAPPTTIQDLTTEYYFVYSVQDWIIMLNNTFTTLCSNLSITHAPFFYFDTNTSLLKIYVPQGYTSEKIYFNKQLQTLINTIPMTVSNPAFSSTELYKLSYYNNNYKNIETLNSIPYYYMSQESTSIDLLNPVKSLVFTTGLFPINPSLTSPPKVFGSDSYLFNNGNNSNLQNILSDFEVNPSNGNTYKNSVQYIPNGEYRLFDMFGRSPLNSIEIRVFWKDQFSNLHQFKLNSGCTADILIMFRRKDYNAVDIDL